MSYTTVRYQIEAEDSGYRNYFDVYFGSNKERCRWYCDSDTNGNKYPLLAVRRGSTDFYAPLGDPSAQSNLKNYQPLRVYKDKVLAPNTWTSNSTSVPNYTLGGGAVTVSVYTSIQNNPSGTVYTAKVKTVTVHSYSRTDNGFYDPVTVSIKVNGGTEASGTVEQGVTSKTVSLSSAELGTSNPDVVLTVSFNGTTKTATIPTTSDNWTTTEKILVDYPFFYEPYQLIS